MAVAYWPLRSFNAPSRRKEQGRGRYRPRPCCAIWDELAPRLRHDTNIGPRRLETLRPDLFGFVVADRSGDDHVFALFPVRGRGYAMLGGQLHGVEDANNFVEI